MSIDKNTNEGKNYRNNVVKSTFGTSKSRINTGFPENISVLSPMMREYCKTRKLQGLHPVLSTWRLL